MNILSELINQKPTSPAITVYMPTHAVSSPPHVHEDQVRFKNLMGRVIDILQQRGEDADIKKFVTSKKDELLGSLEFWEHLTNGLLLCIRPGSFTAIALPFDCDEYVAVDTHYHLAPILGLAYQDVSYYVLAVARKNSRLYEGDMYGLQDSGLELPESLEKALNIDELQQKQQHYHQDAAGFGTGQNAGRGTVDTGGQEMLNYYSMIDSQIINHCDTKRPMVLAGTEDSVGNYRKVTKYPNLCEDFVEGNYTHTKPRELYEKAWAVVSGQSIDKTQQTLEKYMQLSGQNPESTSTDPNEIVRAAEQGRVDTLLTGLSRLTRDTVRDSRDLASKIIFPDEAESQIVDKATQFTWSQSGTILNVDEERMPNSVTMAAIFRY